MCNYRSDSWGRAALSFDGDLESVSDHIAELIVYQNLLSGTGGGNFLTVEALHASSHDQ